MKTIDDEGSITDTLEDLDDEPETDENDGHCSACAGTGEGQYDGAACNSCGGKGFTRGKPDSDDGGQS